MKWIYRTIVVVVAMILFGITYYVNVKGIYRGDPRYNPISPLMISGMYLLGMRMITENVDKYIWKIVMASVSLMLLIGFIMSY
jgi:hypothetical protein